MKALHRIQDFTWTMIKLQFLAENALDLLDVLQTITGYRDRS